MSTRLLSFLNQIQDAIKQVDENFTGGVRMINFNKGIARYTLKDGSAVQVQSFVLADGQTCLKVALYWAGIKNPAVHSVYPTEENFTYYSSAEKISQIWIEGPIAAGVMAGADDAGPALSKLSSIG
jgi:hypothetical protein